MRFKSNTGSLWRGGRLILTGRVHSSVRSSGKAVTRATIQIRRHGRWYTVGHVRLDPRGRFLTRPHLRRAGGARSGSHSTLTFGGAKVPFEARAVRLGQWPATEPTPPACGVRLEALTRHPAGSTFGEHAAHAQPIGTLALA